MRLTLAIVTTGALVLLAACSGATPSSSPSTGPSVSDFKAGACRQVAADVIDIASRSGSVAQGQKTATAVEDGLTTDQGHLQAVVGSLVDPAVQALVRTVIIDIGFFRFTVDKHTFNGSQNTTLATDVADLERACIAARPTAS